MNERELRLLAGKLGSNVVTVEKDYALTWLLRGFYMPESRLGKIFVLKGGTAIRMAYFPDTWRFSEDLDFTVIRPVSAQEIREASEIIFSGLAAESGMRFELDSFHSNESAVLASAKYTGPLNYRNKIKLDISLKETMALQPESRSIKTVFQDMPDFRVLAYSLKEIVAEKIRSIMQRGYSRDYYDVWRLMKEKDFDGSEIRKLLIKKCELKGIEYQPELLFDKERLDGAREHWNRGLGHLTKNLPDFEDVIAELKPTLNFLK